MTVRHFTSVGALLILVAATSLRGQVLSTWWYPLGNPEGTRRNPVQLDTQSARQLVVKWRTPVLGGSPTVLIGDLRARDGEATQQIVGTVGGTTVAVLSERGLLLGRSDYNRFPTPATVRVTGLLNRNEPLPLGAAQPTEIGVGIERRQQNSSDALFCFIADSLGRPTRRLQITAPDVTDTNTVGVYPLMLYSQPSLERAILAVNKLGYAAKTGAVNSVQKYGLGKSPDPDTLIWKFPVAPGMYPQHPAITRDQSAGSGIYFALSTAPYISSPPYSLSGPGGVGTTNTDAAYSIEILDSNAAENDATFIASDRLPTSAVVTDQASRGASYFATLYRSNSDRGTYFRVITEEHNAQRPGIPTVALRPAFTGALSDTATFIPDTDRDSARNHGWTVATADVDGDNPDRSINDPGKQKFFNNKDDELIAAYSNADQSDVENNTLWVLRHHERDAQGGTIPLYGFIRNPFKGRLMAVGHVLADSVGGVPTNKEEVIVAYRNTLRVLRLKDYQDDVFDNLRSEPQQYFAEVASFPLDAPVVSVAIADIDADGRNDIVATTTATTYAIGLAQPEPFGAVSTNNAEYCGSDSITIRWNRRTTGDSSVNVSVVHDNGAVERTIQGYRRYATLDLLNPGAGPDSLTIASSEFPPGTYRVVIRDPLLNTLADSTPAFTVRAAAISNFTVTTQAAPQFGEPVSVDADVSCAEAVRLEVSANGTAWDSARMVPVKAGRASTLDTILCPDNSCDAPDSLIKWYRYVDKWGTVYAGPQRVVIAAERVPLLVQGDTSSALRARVATWPRDTFTCATVSISISSDGGVSWLPLATGVDRNAARFAFTVADSLPRQLMLRVCCTENTPTACRRALASFEVPPVPREGHVAPNPFVPGRGEEAVITFQTRGTNTVRASIYDASNTEVRRIDVPDGGGGFRRALWNGRNSRGEIVAGGTYICIVEDGDTPIVFPIIVGSN